MKSETLEDVAEKYAEENQYDLEYFDEGGCQGIEIESFAKKLVDFTTKWQTERSYSEKEVLRIIRSCKEYLAFGDEFDDQKWFEQFKKK